MRRVTTLSALLVVLLLAGAGSGADLVAEGTDTLRWHTGVFGTSLGYADQQPYYGAARFTPSLGCTLSSVRWYQSGDAATAEVFVWGPGTDSAPGVLIEESLPSSTGEEQWHEVVIPYDRRFPAGQDFWVGVRLADYHVSGGKYPLGADAGPQYPPKRSLYASRNGTSWYHISPPPQQYDRNWLIEAVVQTESLTGVSAGELPAAEPFFELGPNPTSGGSAILRYGLTKPGTVSVTVLDIAGRTVFLRRSRTEAAAGSLDIDLRGSNTGVYLVRLDAEGRSQSRKLVVQSE